MNDINSVPARIVIIGTSTMTLSERFNRINFDKDRSSVNRRAATEFNGGLASDRIMEPPRSYLYDDYMANDLFGTNSRAQSKPREHYNTFFEDENTYNAANMSLDDYVSPRRRAPLRRSFSVGRRLPRSSRFGGFNDAGADRYMIMPVPRRRYRPPRAPPIQEVIEYYEPLPRPAPRARSKIVNVPIHNRISFKRLPRVRNFVAARRRTTVSGSPVKRRQLGGRVSKANIQRNNNNRNAPERKQPFQKKKNEKPIKTAEELDRELEAYMKGSKHPRIEPI